MGDLSAFGRIIIGIGVVFVIIGGVLLLAGQVPGLDRLGRLPGDIVIERGNTKIYIPIMTSILVSIVLSAVLWLVTRR